MLQDPADSATALTPAQPAADEERSLPAGVAADSDPPKGGMEKYLARAAVRSFQNMSREVAIPFWMRHDALRESLRRRTERLERLRPSDFNDPARALIAEMERNPYVCGISFEKMTPKSPGRLAFRVLMRATLTLPGRNPETVYQLRRHEFEVEARRYRVETRVDPIVLGIHTLTRFIERSELPLEVFRENLVDLAAMAGFWLEATDDRLYSGTFAAPVGDAGVVLGERIEIMNETPRTFEIGNRRKIVAQPDDDAEIRTVFLRTFLDVDCLQPAQDREYALLKEWRGAYFGGGAKSSARLGAVTPVEALKAIIDRDAWAEAFRPAWTMPGGRLRLS